MWTKGHSSSPDRSGGKIFSSRVSFLCWLWVSFPPLCYCSSIEKSWSPCLKCSWQLVAKQAPYMWLCMKWYDMVHGCMVHTESWECIEMAAVSHGTSCKYITWVDIQNLLIPINSKKLVTHWVTIVQELCESQGGRPGLSVLTSRLVSVDVKIYWTLLQHWS